MPTSTSHPTTQHHSTRTHTSLLNLSLLAVPALALNISGCTAPESAPTPAHLSVPVAAMVNGQPITNNQLWPLMAEISGQQILEELILTKLLDDIATDSHWTITDTDIQTELDALVTTIDQTTNPKSTPKLIDTIRHRRGLGPARFKSLLRRNAILRRLIPNDSALARQISTQIDHATNQLAAPPSAEHLGRITRRAQLVAHQLAMESVARSLIDEAEILVMDRSLKWSGE